jgi:hypothetical protein
MNFQAASSVVEISYVTGPVSRQIQSLPPFRIRKLKRAETTAMTVLSMWGVQGLVCLLVTEP